MIVPDNKKFLSYVSQIKAKVDNIVKGIDIGTLPEPYKTKIIEYEAKIYARLDFITMHVNKDLVISQNGWEKRTQEIDNFVNKLSDTVNQIIAYLKTKENTR